LITLRKGNSYRLYFWLAIIFAFAGQSCKSLKPLGEEQYYLSNNVLHFQTSEKIQQKEDLRFELESLYLQVPVKRRAWNPRDWGKELIVFEEDLAKETAESMEMFLRNKKGFYNCKVRYTTKIKDNKIVVDYWLDLGGRYKIKSIDFVGEDQKLVTEIKNLEGPAFLKEGDPLDAASFDKERTRITNALQNKGYYNFVSNYLEVEGDSSHQNFEVDVIFNVISVPDQGDHRKYKIGDVNVYTEHLVQSDPEFAIRDSFEQSNYFAKSNRFIVKPKRLHSNIYLRPGNIYKKNDRVKTLQSLSNLSTYRYIYVNPLVKTASDSIIDVDIFLSPHRHRWISDYGLELFYATLSQQNLFGFSGSVSLQNRNLFRGSEKYTFNIDGAIEFALSGTGNTYSFGVSNDLELPRLKDLFGFGKFLSNINLLPNTSYKRFQEEATTEISLGYNYTNITSSFVLNSLNASWGYAYRPNNKSIYRVRQLGLNLFTAQPDSTFQANNIDPNPLLARSLENYFSTGLFFRELKYFYQGGKNKRGRSYGFLGNIELSGLEVFLGNKVSNLISNKDDVWNLGSFNFAKYIKMEADGRIYKDIGRKSTLAMRADFGVVIPYGGSSVPYLTQFYSGGPNSIRAWQIRQLGPDFNLIANPIEGQSFFQAGDIKMEFNLEYRWDWFWFIEGAIFVDAGNVWSIRNSGNIGAIDGNFLDEMAVGIGWGIRFDFDYFIIRFDQGYKLRSPFPIDDSGSHYILTKTNPVTGKPFNSYIGNINVAINYPF